MRNDAVHEASLWCAGGIIDKAEGLLVEFRVTNLTRVLLMFLSCLGRIHFLLVCIK